MQIFYAPDIKDNPFLPDDEAGHALRVLRMNEGDELLITDGNGYFYKSIIRSVKGKKCEVFIQETIEQPRLWQPYIHIAVAPTKNMDRMEWFVEKATEIGIDTISCLLCRYSERKDIKVSRLEKIAVSAMKQSQKARLPQLNGMVSFKQFITQPWEGQKFIAHCEPDNKSSLKQLYSSPQDVLILIGPEGDFSKEEIDLALNNGFQPVSLGESRLRTETAAMVACHTIQLLNQS